MSKHTASEGRSKTAKEKEDDRRSADQEYARREKNYQRGALKAWRTRRNNRRKRRAELTTEVW